jgi:DNA primase
MIPDAIIDEIRGRIDIVAVIGRHMELKRAGRTWKGCCVFHGERTPSFHVYPEDKHFKCYGCGEYGDVFKFLQKLQGKEFPEVVRALAQEVGVAIPEREEDSAEQRRRREERNEVLAACDVAARYFAARLASRFGDAGRTYLASRGFTEETVRLFRLGMAADDWDDLTARLGPKGVSAAALEKAGLVARRDDGRRYDRFTSRLMIPIAALDGEIIGFGGRVLPGAPEKRAKYINSPESVLYKKSRVLYGLDLAREHVRRTRSAVLVEGYFDVIGLHQAGVRNAVAVCGTALTTEHVELLRRIDCRTLTLLFDGDAAGVAAATKAAPVLVPSGIMGKVALLPGAGGKIDPDDFARREGSTAVEALIASAQSLTDYLLGLAAEEHCGANPQDSSFEQRMRAYAQLKPILDAMPDGLAKSTFEERIARRLDVSLAALSGDAGTARAMEARPGPRAAPVHTTVRPQVHGSPAIDAFGILAAFPALADVAREERFLDLFLGVPTESVARRLLDGSIEGDAVLDALDPHLPEAVLQRVRKLMAEARPDPEAAEREFRKATVEAKIEALGQEIDRLNAEVVLAGRPIPEDLRTAMLVAIRRRADLEKRRDGRRPG